MDATSAASRSTSRRCGERRGAAPTRARSRASPGHPVVSAVHMKAHGWVGLAIIGAAEVLLFAGEPTVAGWFTPIVWTGYVLFIDALAARFSGRSYLTTDRVEGVLVALASVAGWWLFELYNAPRFWRGGEDALGLWWRYQGLEPNLFLRRVGYDWSFATIFPALFLTATVLRARVFRRVRVRPWRPPRATLRALVVVGAVAAVLPLEIGRAHV